MKAIFLDIDGVLALSTNGFNFDTDCINRLRALVQETGAKVVLCSSWKESDLQKTVKNLPPALKEIISDQTPNLPGKCKGEEVLAWTETNAVDSYVIFDDEPEHYLVHQYALFMVTTDRRVGLTEKKAKEALWILKHNTKK